MDHFEVDSSIVLQNYPVVLCICCVLSLHYTLLLLSLGSLDVYIITIFCDLHNSILRIVFVMEEI